MGLDSIKNPETVSDLARQVSVMEESLTEVRRTRRGGLMSVGREGA